MVNSSNPSTDRVTIRSHYSCHEASWKPHLPSKYPAAVNFFQQDFPTTSIPTDEHTNRSVSLRSILQWKPCQNILLHAPIFSPTLKFTRQCVAKCGALFGHTPPPARSSVADEPAQPLHALHHCRKSPPFPLFLSDDCY